MFRIVPQLTVSDLPRTLEFYTERLGFAVTQVDPPEAPVFAALERGDASLFLVSQSSREEPVQVEDLKRNKRGVGLRLYLELDDARAEYQRLTESGVAIQRELAYNEAEDYTEFSFLDPDGYEIGIYS